MGSVPSSHEQPIFIEHLETSDLQVISPPLLTVYVAVDGDDDNAGTSPATALATLGGALALLQRRGWVNTATVRFLPGDFAIEGDRLYQLPTPPGDKKQVVVFRSDSEVTVGAFTVAAVATPTNTGFPVLDVGAAVMPDLDGLQAVFTSGGLAGRRYLVGQAADAGPTSLTLIESFDTPAPGDTLEVRRPAARWVFHGGAGAFFTGALPAAFVDLDILLPDIGSGTSGIVAFVRMFLAFAGVRFLAGPDVVSAGALALLNNTLFAGADINTVPGFADAGIPGVGYAVVGGPTPGPGLDIFWLQIGGLCGASRSLVRDAAVQADGVEFAPSQACFQRALLFGVNNAFLSLDHCQFLDAPAWGVQLSESSASVQTCDISGSGASGVQVSDGGARVSAVASALAPNGSYGLELLAAAKSVVIDPNVGTTVTGAVSDAVVGANAPTTWATIAGKLAADTSDFGQAQPLYCSVSVP